VLTGKATGYYSKTGKGSSGLGLGYGTVAVDPDVIPYGTKLYITSTDGKFVYGYAVATDTGIALANMTLAAWDKGVGSCIMGAINKPALTALLGIEEPQKLAFMVAFGYPTHKAGIVPMTEQTGVKYYLDENRDYCVPKRSAEEIARSV